MEVMGQDQPIIQCKNVTLGYGREVILRNVSLEIPGGIFLPFIGPNGAGKTTLLRGILGLIEPIEGKIETPFKTRPAGYVPQHKSVDPLFPLTVREIVAMGLYPCLGFFKRLDAKDKDRIEQALEELALAEHAHKNYRDLSGGTKQKALIARAFVSGADVFVMDESTSELDEASEKEVFRHLAELVSKHRKTVLMAHHGLNHMIGSLASSKICVVNHGKIELVSHDVFT
jgi:ABC-type Mn2+/Zn2+ transport system ATPase subunit